MCDQRETNKTWFTQFWERNHPLMTLSTWFKSCGNVNRRETTMIGGGNSLWIHHSSNPVQIMSCLSRNSLQSDTNNLPVNGGRYRCTPKYTYMIYILYFSFFHGWNRFKQLKLDVDSSKVNSLKKRLDRFP